MAPDNPTPMAPDKPAGAVSCDNPPACDVLVVGSGIAGLWAALRAAEAGASVTVITKRELRESNTHYAQGGIAAVVDHNDSFDDHVRDTIEAGAGLCDEATVRDIVHDGPARIADLVGVGVNFTNRHKRPGEFDLGREGGHHKRRVLHAGDITGEEITRVLCERAREHPRITVRERVIAVDLITRRRIDYGTKSGDDRCFGLYALDRDTGRVETLRARATILATGGLGKVYLYTSNPDIASGDGIAMAYRAGCTIRNMEFVQFHPTCLFYPQAGSFLISEALRGEGGILRNRNGEPFMDAVHEMGSLAPRDVVAQGIDAEMKRTGADCVFLDMTQLDPDGVVARFPKIHAMCMRFGIDMRVAPIPVVPAAHYTCGGVQTGPDGGADIPGLWIVGEAACTGMHGANRLASNSLLEGVVFGDRAARAAVDFAHAAPPADDVAIPAWTRAGARAPDEAVVVTQNWEEVRRLMWNYVGIVRTTRRLLRARRRLELLMAEVTEYYHEFELTSDFVELRNLVMNAYLIVISALRRKESRGLHFTLDYPALAVAPGSTDLTRLELEGDPWLRHRNGTA
jgi:L-aspartate oxidase